MNIPSKIKIIGSYSFSRSKIASILIPSHVKQICEGAFSYCKQLSRVEFEPNSELRTIEKDAFSYSALASILIPSRVTQIGAIPFISCLQFQIVEIEENSVYELNSMNTFSDCKIVMLRVGKKLH